MKDGLYQVTNSYLCAGFVIENNKVTECAPILRKKLRYWLTKAVWISDLPEGYNQYKGENHETIVNN